MPIATQHLPGRGSINVYACLDHKIYAHYTADGPPCCDVDPEQLRQYVDQPTHIEANASALGEDVAIDLGLPGDAALAEAIAIALEYPRQDARSDR